MSRKNIEKGDRKKNSLDMSISGPFFAGLQRFYLAQGTIFRVSLTYRDLQITDRKQQ
jgi:hypothetical protein